jgi:large subunit ribosomal protein L22
MAVRKARLVLDMVRNRTASQALDSLANDNHRASLYVRKVLASAVANALQHPEVRASRLVVSEAYANHGPRLQGRLRSPPSAMGRAMPYRKRTCHIHIKIEDPQVEALDRDREEDAVEETAATSAAGPATGDAKE